MSERFVRLGGKKIAVPWTMIDRMVDYMSPARGLVRLKNRTMMAMSGGYVGGKRDRRATRFWRPKQTSANDDLSPDLPDLRSRSRDLVRNVALATGAIATVVTNVVGDGLVLKSQVDRTVLGISEDAASEWQSQAQREFAMWARRPDFTSRLNFDEMQAQVLRAKLESGDIFVARRRRFDPGDIYGLKLQVIEADRVSNPNLGANRVDLVDGVEMNSDGVPVAYFISSHYPDEWLTGRRREWKRYDLGATVSGLPLIIHLYSQLRPDQARGAPYLAPVVEEIRQLGEYKDAEIRAAVISSMFTVFITSDVPEGADDPIVGQNDVGVDPGKEISLGNGAIVDLAPGEKPEFADPKRPNTGFEAFITAVSRHIGVALELPQEVLLKAFTASYSASRAALEMAWQFFRVRRSWLAWKFCQPVYEWVITEAVAAGRLAAPGFFADPLIREAWLGSDWIGPSRIQLDPEKEANADAKDLEMGTKTRDQIVTERTGGSWERKHEQLVKEERRRAADLPNRAPAPPRPSPKPAPASEEPQTEDEAAA